MTEPLEAFVNAVVQHQAGNLAAAEAAYREILTTNPDDFRTLNNLGLIVRQDEGMAMFKRAVAIKPDHIEALINLAHALKTQGQLDEAVATYERAIAINAAYPRLIYDLANALRAQGKLDEAVAQFRRALALTPDFAEAALQLADALHNQGKLDEAVAAYEQAIALNPNQPYSHFGLASILQGQNKIPAATAHYERAIFLKPDFVTALHNLGTIHDDPNKPMPAAAKWLRWTLTLAPDLADANIRMVRMLEAEGRLAEAKIFGDRVPRPLAFLPETAPEQIRTILLPSVLGPGNVPLHSVLPGRQTTLVRWFVDYATDEQMANLPQCDLIFNGVGNADLSGPSHERLMRLHQQRPMLNPPDRVAPTRRDLLPALLAGIPNVVCPRVLRLRRDEVIGVDLVAKMAEAGIGFPLLMRPIVMHSGGGMVLVMKPEDMATLEFGDSDAFYFIAFFNYSSTDQYFRKYRTIFVDRTPYPYHLAISEKWLVHYFSANMNSIEWKLAEQAKFRTDSAASLGPKASAALDAIAKRLDLDFGGIDYSVLPDGQLLVFEANATMSVFMPDAGKEDVTKEYSHALKIVNAFAAMIDGKIKKGA